MASCAGEGEQMRKRKILTCIGIRPDIIRLSEIIIELDKHFDQVIVDSGQHYDDNLSDVFYRELAKAKADHNLNIRSGTGCEKVSRLLERFEKVVLKEKPEFVIVLGDNDSSFGFGIVTAKLGVPLIHLEAGMRSRNRSMPEEINRIVLDHMADMNLCYLKSHAINLEDEGMSREKVWIIGNPILDIVLKHKDNVMKNGDAWKKKYPSKFFLMTCHRNENVISSKKLKNIMLFASMMGQRHGLPVVFPTFPKTIKYFKEHEIRIPSSDGMMLCEPVGFFEFLWLEQQAHMVFTDSGTVVEECAIMGKPCATIRDTTERNDLIDLGVNVLTGTDEVKNMITAAESIIGKELPFAAVRKRYGLGDRSVAEKVANILVGNSLKFSRRWKE